MVLQSVFARNDNLLTKLGHRRDGGDGADDVLRNLSGGRPGEAWPPLSELVEHYQRNFRVWNLLKTSQGARSICGHLSVLASIEEGAGQKSVLSKQDSQTPTPGVLTRLSKMPNWKRICRLVLPIALLALLIGTTCGEVWHQHINSSPETCPICHFSHQAVEAPSTTAQIVHLVPSGPGPEAPRYSLIRIPTIPRIPARAPPA